MGKIIPIAEHYQHFLKEMQDSFGGDLYGRTKRLWKERWQWDRYAVRQVNKQRSGRHQPNRNGYYERDFMTRLGTIPAAHCAHRGKSFLPRGLERFQRRASMLIREAFLRGLSTRPAGRVLTTLTGEVVSAQTVSKLTRDLDEVVRQFHRAQLEDQYTYLFLDGVSLRVRRPAGRKRVQMLVAYGGRRDGTLICWQFCAAREKARRTGKACSETYTGEARRGRTWD
jgi:Transposase, Mutator family